MMTWKPERKVEIKWLDSVGDGNDWEFRSQLKDMPPAVCYTVGYLLERNDDYTTVALTVSIDQVCGRMTIPNCAIIELKHIVSRKSS